MFDCSLCLWVSGCLDVLWLGVECDLLVALGFPVSTVVCGRVCGSGFFGTRRCSLLVCFVLVALVWVLVVDLGF